MKTIIILLVLLITAFPEVRAFQTSDQIDEELQMRIPASEFNENTNFLLKNINGSVKVTGYEGDDIKVSGTKSLWKKRGKVSAEEAEKFYLDTIQHQNKLCLYVQAPGVKVNGRNGEIRYSMENRDRKSNAVQFVFNLEVKVPHYLASEISTVNGDEVLVENMKNGVRGNNVNGNVTLRQISGETHANTVNGKIQVTLSGLLYDDATFTTVNGNIELEAPENLGAVVTFKTLHGDLYTDFDKVTHLPDRLHTTSKAGAKKYKINQSSSIQIGDGGPEISFKMVNGNAYIKQSKN